MTLFEGEVRGWLVSGGGGGGGGGGGVCVCVCVCGGGGGGGGVQGPTHSHITMTS